MKRRIISIPLIIAIIGAFSIGLASCSKNENKTPEEIIQDAYGNKEFKISFSSETLDKPLEDLAYSAIKIPLLPTPQKVGYIFEGWYLDPEFICPYTDDTLLLHMEDITLYPKWSKERFDHNGSYDIRLSGRIIPESVKLGELTTKYGGYRDFTKQINMKATHIEKDKDDLILKLEYDSVVTTPFGSSGEVFSVSPNKKMPTDIRVVNKIDSLSDPVKTLFFNINLWDLSKPLLLDVSWTNFENGELTEETRYSTTTYYTVELNIEEIFGFSQSFVDTDVPLEKGYYLAKSYYRKEDNGESMGSIYNPVYSYLYSDGKENYKLIKQNSPYLGLVAQQHPLYTPITQNYHERLMAFTAVSTVFDIESRGSEGEILSSYYPETYNGGHYRECAVEFHADTGKFYNIIDIDKDLSKEYLALTAISGYMEREDGMGYIRQILSIDYKNLIKLADCDYKPLDGSKYEYEDKMAFYPGNYADLDSNNLTYPYMKEYGMSIEMPNFFYSAKNIGDNYDKRTIYSSRVTTTPTGKTSALRLSEARGKIGEFTVHAEVFGYDDSKGENLYLDKLSPQLFEGEGYNSMLRGNRIVKNGKSVNVGDTIDLEDLFTSKVNRNIDYSKVSAKGYRINKLVPDFTKEVEIPSEFKSDIAIEFSYMEDDYLNKTVVELREKEAPYIKEIRDSFAWKDNDGDLHYTKDEKTEVGDEIKYPALIYSYGRNKEIRLVDNFYEKDGMRCVNPSKCFIFANNGGFKKLYLPTGLSEGTRIPEGDIELVYELNNEYNEREFVYFHYVSDPKLSYEVINSRGDSISKDYVAFDSEGKRKTSYTTYTYNPYYDKFTPDMIDDYNHIERGNSGLYGISHFDIYSDNGNLLEAPYKNKEDASKAINEFLKDKRFGLITFTYYRAGALLEVEYPYNLTFSGLDSFEVINYDAYFTDTNYAFPKTMLVGDKKNICNVSVQLNKYVDGAKMPYSSNDYDIDTTGGDIRFKFKTPGEYVLETSYNIPKYILGNPTGRSKRLTFYQSYKVQDKHGDIKITYITDDLHPFKGGATKKVVTYNLGEGITTLDDSNDVFIRNDFYPGRIDDVLLSWNTRADTFGDQYRKKEYIGADDFISDYNTDNLTLYAIWDVKFKVSFVVNGITTKVEAYLDRGTNNYIIDFPEPPKQSKPSKPKFIGWSGGFLGDRLYNKSRYELPYSDEYLKMPPEYFIITAQFQDQFLVIFDIDPDIAEFVQGGYVGDGELIPQADLKLKPVIKDKSYVFDRYVLMHKDGTYEEIGDLREFVVGWDKVSYDRFGTQTIELKAIFKKK